MVWQQILNYFVNCKQNCNSDSFHSLFLDFFKLSFFLPTDYTNDWLNFLQTDLSNANKTEFVWPKDKTLSSGVPSEQPHSSPKMSSALNVSVKVWLINIVCNVQSWFTYVKNSIMVYNIKDKSWIQTLDGVYKELTCVNSRQFQVILLLRRYKEQTAVINIRK